MALKKVYYYNSIKTINDNFGELENLIEDVEITPAAAITNAAAGTNITTVPASFSDLASVQSYLAGANVVPNIETRLDALTSKLNEVIAALRTVGIINS